MSQRLAHWTLWICILLSGNATAQLLTKGEYFFDNDPGEGFGTLVYINPQIANPNITFNAPATGLTPGFHFFSMRFQDQFGNWGITGTHKIYINQPFFPFPAQVLSMPIVGAEYFWDADPGCGNGTAFYMPAGNNITSTFSVISPNISGTHLLSVRTQDLDGRWGITRSQSIQVWPVSANVADVDFTMNPNPAAVNQNITMTSQVSGALPGAIYEWDFNSDGAADATSTNANHAYNAAGYKHVSLTVCNPPSALAQAADMRYYFTNGSLADAGGWMSNLTGGTQWQYGRQGDLSGVAYHPNNALTASSSNTQTQSQYTIAYWMKGSVNQAGLIRLGSASNEYQGIDNNGYHRWSNGNTIYANAGSQGAGALFNNQWHHIVVTVAGSNLKSYVDGVGVQTQGWGGSSMVPSQIELSASNNVLDDILFYNTTLTDAQIQSLWQEMYASTRVHEIPVGPVFNLQLTANGPTNICSGSNVILTAPSANSYYWNTGETTQSIVVTETGSYQCVMNFGAYSIVSVQKDVLVRPTPIVSPTVFSPTNGNTNGSIYLNVSGGSFPVYTYNWNNGNTTPALTQLSGGAYTVNVSDGFCPQTLTYNLVNQVVVPPVGFIEAECFFGAVDPGPGNGVSFLIPMNTLTSGGTFDVPTTGLPIGFHLLSVRTKHTQQGWSTTKTHWVHVKPDYSNPVNYDSLSIVRGELFFDNVDPGVGNGVPIQFTTGTDLNFNAANISLSGLSPGYHKVSLRMQDENGEWGITRTTVFLIDYVLPPNLSPLQSPMVAAEYFYGNTDPGQGNGTPISIPVDSSLNVNRVISTTGLSVGTHRLNVRVLDLSGVWSTTRTHLINITNPCSLPSASFTATETSLNQLTLTSTSTGVTGSTSYAWDIEADGVVEYTTTNATHDFSASGWHDVLLTVTNGTGCSTSSLQSIQIGVPTSNQIIPDGPLIFCQGEDVVLYAPEGSGYIWNDFSQQNFITVTSSGVYQCAYIDENGDYVFSNAVEVVVIPALSAVTNVVNSTNGLANGSALISVSGGSSNIYTYSWSIGASTPAIAGVMAGNYSVTVTDGECPQTIPVNIDNTVIQPLSGIIAAEYYFDVDPGVGNGIPMTIPQGSPINAFVNIPINISPGYHVMFVRALDAQFEWGIVRAIPISVWDPNAVSQNTPADNIVKGEYFFDNNDPGAGNAQSFQVTNPGVNIMESVSINTTGLNSGVHYIYVRMQDADGRWGMIARSMFIIEFELPPNLPDFKFPIVAMEYFFDNVDPGVGNGIAAAIPIDTLVNSTASINTAGLALGWHKLSVRVKDQWGIWSTTKVSSINVVTPTCPVPAVNFTVSGNTVGSPISFASTSTNTLLSSVYSWDWNGDGIYEGTGSSTSYTYPTAGNYVVVLQVNNGNATCTSTSSQLISIGSGSALISVNGGLDICEGSSTMLTAPLGSNYIWSNALTTQSITVMETGSYSCTFLNASGVWQQSQDIFVLVRPSLNINPISSAATNGLSNGSAGVLVTGGSSPVYIYSWSNGATTPIIAGVLSGSYNVTVTDGFCPQSISVLVSNTIVTSGILRGEYFWDGVDPGPGNATDILLTQGSPINSFANVPTTGLAAGYHVLSVRMIDFQEEWGFVRNLPVYISPIQTPAISELPDITEVEYFFDNIDPGVSNASSLALSVQDTLISESYAISCALLGPGNHKISMRVKDATGKWGITKTASFNTCFPPPSPPLTLNALGDTINTAEVCLGSNHNFIAQTSPFSLRWTSPNGQQTHVGNNWYRFNLGLQDTGYYWVQALGSEPGCYSEPSLYHLTVLESPVVTETVSGLQVVCPYDGPQAYFINPIENAVFYTWNMPTGAALLTGNNTNNASITFEDVIASSGSISVTAANQCGSSNSGILALNFPCVEEDYDGDGVMNLIDNCFLTANTNQLDADADGVGDVCDNCPLYSNADQTFAVLYQDADGDGFGNSSITIMGCPGAPGTANVAGDCDDANALMHDLFNFYYDTDGDGYGAGTALIPQCAQSAVLPPAGYSAVNTDCAYANPAVNPGVSESCGNSIDDNCNGEINEGCTNVTPGDEPTAAIPSININQYGTGVQWSSAADLTIGTNSNQSMGTGNDLWFQFIAQNNAVRISLKGSTVVNDDNDLALYNSTTNWNTVLIPIATENDVHPASLGISTDGGNEILYYDQLVVGQTYYICVRNNNSTPGSCILTISYLKGSQADIGAYTGNTNIYSNTCQNFKASYRANAYQYVINRRAGSSLSSAVEWSYTIPHSGTVTTSVCQVGKVFYPNLTSANINEYVSVDVQYVMLDAFGNQVNVLGRANVISTVGFAPETDLYLRTTDQCPVFKSTTSSLATNRSVCGTSQYNWNFTMVSPTVGLPIIVNGPTGGSRILGMGMITGIANGQRYDVKIRTRHLDGLTLSNYGMVKCVKTLGAAGMPSMDNINNLNILAERQDILIYPNPGNGESIQLLFPELEGAMSFSLYDVLGNQIAKREVTVTKGSLVSFQFDKSLSSGLYYLNYLNSGIMRTARFLVVN